MNRAIATNRKAQRDYDVIEILECGIELKGSEVKSLRGRRVNLDDSFARIENNEIILYNTHISPYEHSSFANLEPARPRKLLLHSREIRKLTGSIAQKGFTLVPLKAYFNERGFVKIELALCKGKKLYDRRQAIKRKEAELQVKRTLRRRR